MDHFTKAKAEAEKFYFSIEKVYSWYFREDILFEADGWDHLLKTGRETQRLEEEQLARFDGLKLAPWFLQQPFPPQRVRVRKTAEETIMYWKFIVDYQDYTGGVNYELKIIVRQIDNGPKKLYSVFKDRYLAEKENKE